MPIIMDMINIPSSKINMFYAGKSSCQYAPTHLIAFCVEMAASTIYCMFPDLDDRRLWVGDGQPFVGSCSGHSHHNGNSLDINYFTQNLPTGMTPNATHYRKNYPQAVIWDGTTLIEERFHFAANYMMFRFLKEMGVKYRTSDWLKDAYLSRWDGTPGGMYDVDGMNGDFGATNNHHIHAHLDFWV